MIQHACTQCGALSPEARCPAHRYRDRRPSAAKRGYDARWRATRARFLRWHPTCEYAGCVEPATEVHHVDGLGPKGPRGHDDGNLAALCSHHHKLVTSRQQPGGWAAPLTSTTGGAR